MPITDEGYSYEFPDEVKKLITKEFLTTLRYEICKIENLEGFTSWDEYNNESTAGWYVAFGMACMRTKNDELFKHAKSLEWFEYDIFGAKLTDLMDKEKIYPFGNKIPKSYYQFALKRVEDYAKSLKIEG